jgi:HEPN domain-containing protein
MEGEEPFLDTAVYHCQQAAEKALKAYLTLQDAPFEKIHDLTVLIEQCSGFNEGFKELLGYSEILTPYATAFRYPGDVLEPARPDAEEAAGLAERIVEFVIQKMPEEVKPDLPRQASRKNQTS